MEILESILRSGWSVAICVDAQGFFTAQATREARTEQQNHTSLARCLDNLKSDCEAP